MSILSTVSLWYGDFTEQLNHLGESHQEIHTVGRRQFIRFTAVNFVRIDQNAFAVFGFFLVRYSKRGYDAWPDEPLVPICMPEASNEPSFNLSLMFSRLQNWP